MSNEVKELQIGRLVTAQIAARRDFVHQTAMVKEASDRYTMMGNLLGSSMVSSDTTRPGHVITGTGSNKQDFAGHLLSEAELSDLLSETEQARTTYLTLNRQLADLGVHMDMQSIL